MTTAAAPVRLKGGRRTLVSALANDPLWPTRHPLGFATRALDGRGRPGPLPPGPVGLPGVGVWPWYSRRPCQYLQDCARRYGDVFRVPLPLVDVIHVNHPDYAAHILNDRNGRYSFASAIEPFLRRTVGVSVVMTEGEDWRQRRALLAPMFGRRHLGRVADTIVGEFAARVDRWDQWAETGEVVDLQAEIGKVTLPGFMRSMFSTTITDADIADIDADVHVMTRFTALANQAYLPPNLLPLPGVPSVPAALWRMHRTLDRLIAHRKANPLDGSDLLDLLLDARYPDGTPLNSRDLKMELLTMITGGYETLAAAMSWTLALLSQNPGPAEMLYAEIDELGGAPPTIDDLARLSWAKACFDEGQRLQGSPLNGRFALEDDEIGGYAIPKGTLVGVPVYAMHRDPRWWSDPDRYDPMRFIDKKVIEARPKLAYQPFGAGPHHCIGAGMAYMNAQFLLTLIFQRFRLHTPVGWRPQQHSPTLTTTIKGGLPVTITRAPARSR